MSDRTSVILNTSCILFLLPTCLLSLVVAKQVYTKDAGLRNTLIMFIVCSIGLVVSLVASVAHIQVHPSQSSYGFIVTLCYITTAVYCALAVFLVCFPEKPTCEKRENQDNKLDEWLLDT